MPFSSIEAVRKRVDGVSGMSDKQVRAYMDAFNGCVDDHDGAEEGEDFNCFAIAMAAAKNAGGGD